MPPDTRRKRLDDLMTRERAVAERVERLSHSEELMNAADADALSDDSGAVKAAEEGVEWEVLTGPPTPKTAAEEA